MYFSRRLCCKNQIWAIYHHFLETQQKLTFVPHRIKIFWMVELAVLCVFKNTTRSGISHDLFCKNSISSSRWRNTKYKVTIKLIANVSRRQFPPHDITFIWIFLKFWDNFCTILGPTWRLQSASRCFRKLQRASKVSEIVKKVWIWVRLVGMVLEQ